jgi:hypothetical protein
MQPPRNRLPKVRPPIAYEATTHAEMEVPVELVPAVRELIAKRRAG